MSTRKEIKREVRLVKHAKKGDRHALEKLIKKYINFCYSISINLLNDEKQAKTATENTLNEVYDLISRIKKPRGFQVWIYSILKKNIDNLRQKGEILNAAHMPEKETFMKNLDEEISESLRKKISTMTNDDKELLVLIDFEGLSCVEVALLQGKPVNEIREQLYQVKQQLYKVFQKPKREIGHKELPEPPQMPVATPNSSDISNDNDIPSLLDEETENTSETLEKILNEDNFEPLQNHDDNQLNTPIIDLDKGG